MNKYELTNNTIVFNGEVLHQIKALVDFGSVHQGYLGGFIEKESNLSQEGNAWVSDNARVSGGARVSSNAWVSGNASVSDNARVSGYAMVSGDAEVYDNASVSDNARVSGDASIFGDASVFGDARVSDNAAVFGDAKATSKVFNLNFLTYNVTLTDNHIRIGCKQFTYEVALKLSKKDCGELFSSAEFKRMWKHKKLLLELIKLKRPDLFKKERK